MGFLFILVLIILMVSEVLRAKSENKNTPTEIVEDVTQWCPPHKWKYLEVKDKEGNFLRHKLTCELCGPLKPLD